MGLEDREMGTLFRLAVLATASSIFGQNFVAFTEPVVALVHVRVIDGSGERGSSHIQPKTSVKDSRLILPAVFECGPDRNGTVQTD